MPAHRPQLSAGRLPLVGMVVALALGLLLGLFFFRAGTPPELTREELDAARYRWEERGPESYQVTLQMGGALTDRRRIVVAEGVVTAMTISDRPAAEPSWQYWSVEGMFDFLQAELDNAQDPPPTLGVTDPDQIVLRAEFDPELGYPTRFFRHILGRQRGTSWEVVEFSPLP